MKIMVFNSVAEALTYTLLIAVIILNIIGLAISASNAKQAKIIAAQNQKFSVDAQNQTVQARIQNMQRQQQITDYIKCIVLLRFYQPPITTTSTKPEVETALDSCANKQ